MFKFRDLTIIEITPENLMVISCDSSGGIGNKDGDVIKVEPEFLGYYTTHCALMELLATGAMPISIVNTLGVEMEDTGARIIKGIKNALEPLNLKDDIVVTGSTEENIAVCQTSMGITIIGMIDRSKWRLKKAEINDLVIVVGLPKVGQEVVLDMGRETMSVSLLLELLKKPYVKEILPVGSKGIAYEIKEMAVTSNLNYNLYDTASIDIHKSAGPSTCVIIAIDKEGYEDLKKSICIPVNLVGSFI